jgi:AraC-like DNA-binding protein
MLISPHTPILCHTNITSARRLKPWNLDGPPRALAYLLMKGSLSRISDWPELARAAHYSVKKLAEKCCVSKSKLRRFIITQEGKQLHEWLKDLRMEAALGRLQRGDSVKEVAYELRYSEPCHFSRDFKQFYGIHPSQARRAKDFRPPSK